MSQRLMRRQGTVVLYHGTDKTSALEILNDGLDAQKLHSLQSQRKTQAGTGWYVSDSIAAAWYFASIAPGNTDDGFTVVEFELHIEHLEMLLEQGLASKSKIANVLFDADQYRFDSQAFVFLNQQAVFRPYRMEE